VRISDFGFPSDFGLRVSDFRAAGFALFLTGVTLEQPCTFYACVSAPRSYARFQITAAGWNLPDVSLATALPAPYEIGHLYRARDSLRHHRFSGSSKLGPQRA
jgi:hypothetical protein